MAKKVTGEQRFTYIASRVKRHAEEIEMGAEELSAILISISAQLLAQTEVKLQDVVATLIADYLDRKERAKAAAPELLVKPIALVQPEPQRQE